uniref:LsmAD domain-containing protein n=1 Tax=Plectus sambesii TaxID=2011161 RepID=A0A914V083_9BILA
YAHEVIPGEETLLPRRDRVIDKLQFDPADVLSVSVVIDDEEHHKGFAMDKDIGARNGAFEAGRERELEEWVPEDEDDLHHLEGREATSHRGDGWSVEEMFNVNKGLGVESTFQDDLRQYTTVDVEGDDDAHAKAAAIAREIEMNPASKHMSMLENDDDERDLNKETNFVGPSGKAVNSPPAGYSGPSRQNSTGSQQGHRMTFSNRGGGGGGGASRSIGGPGGAGADRRGGGASGRGAGGRGGQVGGSYSTPRSGGYGGGGQNAGGAVAGGPRNQGGAA